MGGFTGIALPDISGEKLDDAKERRQILNYLSMLDEKLRYMFQNISIEDNFSEAGRKEYQENIYELNLGIENNTKMLSDLNGNYSALVQTVNGIDLVVAGNSGNIASLQMTAQSIKSTVSDLEDDLDDCWSEIEQTADQIKMVVSSGSSSSSLTLTDEMFQAIADDIQLVGEVAIMTDEWGGRVGGYIGYATGDDAINASTEGVAMSDKSGDNYFIATTSGVRMTYDGSTAVYCTSAGAVMVDSGDSVTWNGNFWCDNDGNLGKSSSPWDTLYAASVPIEDSDRNKKNSISYDVAKYEELFKRLKPAVFKLNKGTSGRYHMGMISQDVEDAMKEIGMDSTDFAGFVKSPRYGTKIVEGKEVETDEIVGYDYALRYGEFTSLNTHMIQKLIARVTELENKLEALS